MTPPAGAPGQAVVERRCRWCGRRFEVVVGPGRPKEFCRRSCRQRDYEARQRSLEVGLSEHELILTRQSMDDLRDRLYVLEAAIEDVERDLTPAATRAELREAIDWLLEAARPLQGVWAEESPDRNPDPTTGP